MSRDPRSIQGLPQEHAGVAVLQCGECRHGLVLDIEPAHHRHLTAFRGEEPEYVVVWLGIDTHHHKVGNGSFAKGLKRCLVGWAYEYLPGDHPTKYRYGQ